MAGGEELENVSEHPRAKMGDAAMGPNVALVPACNPDF